MKDQIHFVWLISRETTVEVRARLKTTSLKLDNCHPVTLLRRYIVDSMTKKGKKGKKNLIIFCLFTGSHNSCGDCIFYKSLSVVWDSAHILILINPCISYSHRVPVIRERDGSTTKTLPENRFYYTGDINKSLSAHIVLEFIQWFNIII